MTPKTTKPRTKPASPAAAPRRRAAATSHEPPTGAQTATREGESSHAAPVDRSPEKSNSAAAEGSPASAAPSTPATHGDRRALVGGILGAVPRRERGAFAGAVYAAAAAPEAHQRAAARVDLNIGPHAYHAAALLHTYGVNVAAIDAPPAVEAEVAATLAFDLDAAVAVLDAGEPRPRLLRLAMPRTLDACDGPDLAAVLRAVGYQVERACNGDLGIALATAQRLSRGEPWPWGSESDGTLADALAGVADALVTDAKHAAKSYRASYATLAAARRNDDAATVARREQEMRGDRDALLRCAVLAGRVAELAADAVAVEDAVAAEQ